MGQKVNPNGIRLGITKQFTSNWYAGSKDYAKNLASDFQVRQFLLKELKKASVSRICIERPAKSIKVTIHTARPAAVVGKGGDAIDSIREKIKKMTGLAVQLEVVEIRKPEIDSKLVADSIADQLERRVMFRRAMKKAIQSAMHAGAKGIKVAISGRLGGAEIARSEWIREGRVPLHTLRADIDYAISEANTTYGVIGIKVWIFKGEVLGGMAAVEQQAKGRPEAPSRPRRSRGERGDRGANK